MGGSARPAHQPRRERPRLSAWKPRADRARAGDLLQEAARADDEDITHVGTPDQKKRFVGPVLAGEKVSALAITEPGGGSDVAALRTKAVRDGDHYVVNGARRRSSTRRTGSSRPSASRQSIRRRCRIRKSSRRQRTISGPGTSSDPSRTASPMALVVGSGAGVRLPDRQRRDRIRVFGYAQAMESYLRARGIRLFDFPKFACRTATPSETMPDNSRRLAGSRCSSSATTRSARRRSWRGFWRSAAKVPALSRSRRRSRRASHTRRLARSEPEEGSEGRTPLRNRPRRRGLRI